MVKSVIAERSSQKLSLGFGFIANKTTSVIVKAMWIIGFIMCIALFSYQTCDRVIYYYSEPVSVDVSITTKPFQIFPHIVVCYAETGELLQLFSKFRKGRCGGSHIFDALRYLTNVSANEIWDVINTSRAVVSATAIAVSIHNL